MNLCQYQQQKTVLKLKEKQQFQSEMTEVNRKLVVERKRLKQDEMFFDKKIYVELLRKIVYNIYNL